LSSEAFSSRRSQYEARRHLRLLRFDPLPYSRSSNSLSFPFRVSLAGGFHILFCLIGLCFLNRFFYHWRLHVLRGLGLGLRFSWNCGGNLEGRFC